MGCNCKNSKKIEEIITGKPVNKEKKGFLGVMKYFSLNLLSKIFVIVLMVILVPVVFLILIWSYLIKGKMSIKVPKEISNLLKKNSNE